MSIFVPCYINTFPESCYVIHQSSFANVTKFLSVYLVSVLPIFGDLVQ